MNRPTVTPADERAASQVAKDLRLCLIGDEWDYLVLSFARHRHEGASEAAAEISKILDPAA